MRLALDARKLTDFGIGTYLSALLRGLEERDDIRLTVVARPGHEGRVERLAPSARVVTTSAGGYTVAEHLRVPAAMWRERVDLVHIPHYVVPALTPRPVVSTIHDVIQLFYPPSDSTFLALLYLRLTLRSALRRSRVVITVSRTSRRDLVNLFKADPGRLVVVPNGVDPELAVRPSAEEVDALKEFYGLRAPLVLVVANDKPHKNLDFVLRAYHLAMRRHRVPGQLVFVGGVEPSSRLAARAERLGMAEHVRFLGRVPQSHLRALYHVAAVLLHVALYEGFGLPVLEAMRAGLPVVTSNVGAMRELGEDAARLVNPLDVGEVARAVEQVLVDDPLRRRMVEAGRRRAERLTWERTVDETVAAYRRALGED
ncbi:MAG TPA: glycosyltransferase family 1 protein [Methylomirabilota bacterium]|nr:glycosyltransferase family 1 protein [Methylomirabilota bacterium]